MCDIDDKVLNLFADAFSVNLSVQRLDLSYTIFSIRLKDYFKTLIQHA